MFKNSIHRIIVAFLVLNINVALIANTTLKPRYDSISCDMIVDINSPCNKGSEPFFKFLCKFRDNEDFRNQRLNLTEEELEALPIDEQFEIFEENWVLIDDDGEPSYIPISASWFNVSANVVYYADGESNENQLITVAQIYKFERVEGKWYLTQLLETE